MILKRTWIVTEALTRDDIEWLLRSKLDCEPGEQHYLDFVDIGTKQPVKIAGKRDPAKIYTYTDKEETWLKLYFADKLILYTEECMYKYDSDTNFY